jgi:hypothetical protein
MSALAVLLRKQGARVEPLPVLSGDRFTLLRAWRGLWAARHTLRIRQRQWRQFDGARDADFLPPYERMAWEVFSEAETQGIVRAAKAAGVTVNTYLLFHVDAAISTALTRPYSDRLWMVPVNLRGAVKRARDIAPHMAFFGVNLASGASLTGLQTQIARLKEQDYHWGAWTLLHAGALVGAKGMRRDIRQREKRNHGWTGIFSNLGVWSVPGGGQWIFGPAISRVHPVGAGCITMNGRMALTLQLHAAFGASLQAAHALLQDWKNACLQKPNVIPHSTLDQAVAYG